MPQMHPPKSLFSRWYLFAIGVSLSSFAQDITAFTDANNRLYKFDAGVIHQINTQLVRELHISNSFVCYVDSKRDVYVDFDREKIQMDQRHDRIIATDNLLIVQSGSILRLFEQGKKRILTSTAMPIYAVRDSIVVWQDKIGGELKYYYNGQVETIAMIVGEYPLAASTVGQNTFVYTDNAGNTSAFWRGKFYPLYSSNRQGAIRAGQDVVAFNDPQSGTFAAFDNGYLIDIDTQHAIDFQCGDNFIYYQDAAEVHKVIREEEVMELGVNLQNVRATDSLVVFEDAGMTKVWYQMQVYPIYNTPVETYATSGGIMAYTNQWGGVSAFVRGKEVEITRRRVERFTLYGNTIAMQTGPSSYTIWWKGTYVDF